MIEIICPRCEKQKLKSTILSKSLATSLMMDGEYYVSSDPEYIYRCSNNHFFRIKEHQSLFVNQNVDEEVLEIPTKKYKKKIYKRKRQSRFL